MTESKCLVDLQKVLGKFPKNPMTKDVTLWAIEVDVWHETFKELFSAVQKNHEKLEKDLTAYRKMNTVLERDFIVVSRKQLSDVDFHNEWLMVVFENKWKGYTSNEEKAFTLGYQRPLKKLLSASEHHFLTVGEAREKLKEVSKSSEEPSPAHRLLRTCCGKQYDKNETSKETEKK